MKNVFITILFLITASAATVCQNVGIGTSNPVEKLQVTGNIKADTVKPNAIRLTPNAGSGKVLTSDATGNASWQSMSASSNQGAGSWGDCSMNGIGNYQAMGDTTGAADDHLGYRVAISGDFAIVSAPFDDVGGNVDQGSVSFYHFNGAGWDLMQKTIEAGGSAGDYFGGSISISGNYAIVACIGDDIGLSTNQGSALIYHYNGSAWVFLQKLTDPTGVAVDLFGTSVSMDGNFAIVSANTDDVGINSDQGSACIFQNISGTWVFMQKISDAFGSVDDYFGTSVAVSGSNIIVGEPNDDITVNPDQGSVLFYYFNGSSWVLRIKLTDATGDANDNFGNYVSLSGNNAVVGSPLDDWTETDEGSVSVYRLNGVNWEFAQRLRMDEPGNMDGFGLTLNISGNYIIVGTQNDNIGTINNKGSATIFEKIGVGWSKVQYVQDKMGTADDEFGAGVGIDGNTKRFLVGSFGYAQGSGKVLFGKVL